ncbi:insect inhibitor with A fungal trypsin [Lophiostoma macrostomum CBS 122681]|uniref:Insect inhibitor with A fungal trypsin n=1 Tax=Lophiostoma macrostomum CBS 122681 TaxID=1314788 RepID=A0A6A6TRW0_9PLEO|nr:insect inhibitor with A fungal trypsin [Lophiostoma macrostomum CBS 122681]
MGVKSLLVAAIAPAVCYAAAIPGDNNVNIVGGTTAAQGDFPFIVSLQKSGSHFCGGSLLNANTVLTAGHCAQGQTASSIKVRAGSLNYNSGGTLVSVSSIKINPNFSINTLDSDVAIFKLSTSIPTSSTISYATLAASGEDPAAGATVTVAGWGTTSEGGNTLPTALRKVSVPVVSRTECRSDYSASEITDSMWCAGLAAGGKDSCQGDSGGPIVDSSKTLLGTVSWGDGCAEAGKPGVYARIGYPSVNSWIKSQL